MKLVRRSRRTGPSRATVILLGGSLFLSLACLAAPFFSASAGQDNRQAKETRPDLKSFAGTWKASFQGEVFAILVLAERDGKLTGTLNNFDISVDKDGDLAEGTHKDVGDAPLLNVRFESGALLFVVIEKDAYSASAEWKFVPKTAEEGELTPLHGQPDARKDSIIKPIRMVREPTKP